ncbi:MAG: helix-hairpin-helix domain-containing protein, partial [Candidatus Atribacteria bacterium]|nr:helix-hairpin-helix domain-containing protein [Candidatus Atribacteria bacterium]
GDTIAQRIIDYRETYGPFQSIEDLLNVKGIGDKKLQDIKDSISFN